MSAHCERVEARHLRRKAYLYVRQSTLRQVFENTESTKRQYALKQRAVALGWPDESIVVIDHDLGQSGASTADREGFQRLVSDVGLGRAGMVMGLEVSRLARNSADWHRLLEICALTDTLILDEDGVYDPAHFNDRLLLGLKGTMSEAELHIMKARLRGGLLAKARRGELATPLPIGFVYDGNGGVVLDPDSQIQETIRHFFKTFLRTGSATATVKAFRAEGLSFPRRPRRGGWDGPVLWAPLVHSRAVWLLHNPRYAGAFFFGRIRQRKNLEGRKLYEHVPLEECHSLVRDAHPGYIGWEEFQENRKRLQENCGALSSEGTKTPPREGPALLQGLVICGRCGMRMTVRYHQRKGGLFPDYICQRHAIENSIPICQVVPGAGVDSSIASLLLDAATPLAMEVALSVQDELETRRQQADKLRYQQVERAQYEADLARRRYMQVDPENRLVADQLEGDWNGKLRALKGVQEEYERQKANHDGGIGKEQRARILALSTDFTRLWHDPATPQRERKRMVRLLIEDVTLHKDRQIIAHVRFKGGATRTITMHAPRGGGELRQTPKNVVSQIDEMLDTHTWNEISDFLNGQGFRAGLGGKFSPRIVWSIQRRYNLTSRYDRLRQAGMLTAEETAQRLGVCSASVKSWRLIGLLKAHQYDGRSFLYEPPGSNAPVRGKHKGIEARRRLAKSPYEKDE